MSRFETSHMLLRSDHADSEDFEVAIDEAIRDHNPWALLKTYPDMRQWLVDVLDYDRACSSCAFAYSVELLFLTPARDTETEA